MVVVACVSERTGVACAMPTRFVRNGRFRWFKILEVLRT